MSFFASVGSLFGLSQSPAQASGPFTPSYEDICQVRALLKALDIPTELVLQILDHAEYWPQHSFVTSPEQRIEAAAQFDQSSHATLCLDVGIFNNDTVNPIRKGGEHPKVKDLLFEIDSHDQGWTSENTRGTYSTSSWVEVSILRGADENNARLPEPDFEDSRFSDPSDFHNAVSDRGWYLVKRPEEAEQGPQDGEGEYAWYLQGNLVAARRTERSGYRVVCAERGFEGNEGAGTGLGFLEELTDCDRILIWARAKWPGWQCIVESVKVTVRYGF